jgi:hypothetical protein
VNEGRYGLSFDPSFDQFPCVFIESDIPRTEDHAVGFDRLGEDGHRSRGIGSADFGYGVHCGRF